jgi:hypothetical protein
MWCVDARKLVVSLRKHPQLLVFPEVKALCVNLFYFRNRIGKSKNREDYFWGISKSL